MKTQYQHANQSPTPKFAKRRTHGLPSALRRQALSGRSVALLALIAALSIFLAYAPTGHAQVSADATLSALTLQAGEQTLPLDSAFTSDDTAYTAVAESSVPWLTVIPTPSDSNATIMVNTPVLPVATSVNSVAADAVDSVAASSLLLLNIGANDIDVEVTSADGSTTKTYTVTVTRADAGCNESDTGIKPTQDRLLADCATLLGLKDALVGSGADLNWAADVAIASWDGNKVSGDDITEIDLSSKGLTGVIPPRLGSLDDLTSLNIRNNKLTGEIPPELGNLDALTSLDISDNQLTGEIPPELGNLDALTSLLLNANQLTGEIPSELGNLTALTLLYLDDNQLTGEIPSELGIASILDLYLHCNELTGSIPAELANIKRSLWLQGNPLNSVKIPTGLTADKVRLSGATGTTWDAVAWCGPPAFADDSATRTVIEGAELGEAIGAPVESDDPDNYPLSLPSAHALTYTLGGIDAFYFTIEDDSGQLRVRRSADLDYYNPSDADMNNEYELTVIASDGVAADDNGGEDSIDVTVRVTRNVAADATLSRLALYSSTSTDAAAVSSTPVTLTPSFAPGITEYKALVGSDVTSVVVTASTTVYGAGMTVDGDAVDDGATSTPKFISVGDTDIHIDVTAKDDSDETYTITVTRADPADDATLSGLTLSEGTLDPTFTLGTLIYKASVDNSVESVTVTASTTDDGATIKVAGDTVASGAASASQALIVGDNTIDILVTSSGGSRTTYTVTVNRAASSDATLSGLTISEGTLDPTFAADTENYTASVAYSVGSVTVTPTAHSEATIKVAGDTVVSGDASASQALTPGGETDIEIVVTAGDNMNTKTYTITVTRAADTSSITHLIDLVIVATTTGATKTGDSRQLNLLDPSSSDPNDPIPFSRYINTYTATVTTDLEGVTVFATSAAKGTSIAVAGGSDDTAAMHAVARATQEARNARDAAANYDANKELTFTSHGDVGSTAIVIKIVVISANGSEGTYTITIERKAPSSADASLSPSFDSTELIYAASVANSMDSVTVTPTANAPIRAVIPGGGSAFVAGGSANPDRDLVVATNTVRTTVTAEDGSTQQIL